MKRGHREAIPVLKKICDAAEEEMYEEEEVIECEARANEIRDKFIEIRQEELRNNPEARARQSGAPDKV